MREFWEIADDLTRESRDEQLAESREIVASGIAQRHFIDHLRRIQPGEVVTVVVSDGVPLHGRIVTVGADWLRLAEVVDAAGTARARAVRVHELPIHAVIRLVREPR